MFKSHRGKRVFFPLISPISFLGLVSPGDSENFPSSTLNNTTKFIIAINITYPRGSSWPREVAYTRGKDGQNSTFIL